MILKYSLVGLPNVGKSTIFNMLTNVKTKIANFPFCTIKPTNAIIDIPDIRIKKLAYITKINKTTNANIEIIDIGGLIKGSVQDVGLGKQFLNSIRETDAIIHVVRCFDDDKIFHVEKQIDPQNDITTIQTELALSDIERCENAIYRLKNNTSKNIKNLDIKLKILKNCMNYLNKNITLKTLKLKKEEKDIIKDLKFLTLKPTIYIANINNKTNINIDHIEAVKNIALCDKSDVLIISALRNKHNIKEKEITIKTINTFYEENNKTLYLSLRKIYDLLKLKTFFTFNKKEIKAWAIIPGTTALDASNMIHSHFMKGFIKTQVIQYEDFVKYKGESNVKKLGKMRFEGKNYIIKDGDIIKFLFKTYSNIM